PRRLAAAFPSLAGVIALAFAGGLACAAPEEMPAPPAPQTATGTDGEIPQLLTGPAARVPLEAALALLREEPASARAAGGFHPGRYAVTDGGEITGRLRADEIILPQGATVFVRGGAALRATGSITLRSRIVFLRGSGFDAGRATAAPGGRSGVGPAGDDVEI